jgi:hypothetical protein
MSDFKGANVKSTIGQLVTDTSGSPVAALRINPYESYADVPKLLQDFVNEANSDSWDKIKKKIDYTYDCLGLLLKQLDEETHFSRQIANWITEGRKLLFKPNLVNPACIDPMTHGEDIGYDACTSWTFFAALMRWFHDELDVSYCDMSVGEAGTSVGIAATFYTLHYSNSRRITTEAIIEGKSQDFYGGWGFYFARKYLSENHPPSHHDDPMKGYDESVAGEFIPPGHSGNRLMVYDLNRINDLKAKRRDVSIPDGVNYKEITLHKAVTGGEPESTDDMKDYPGCVLVNVPRLKVHNQTLFTNAIKNLGVGLYSMQVAADANTDNTNWKYSFPPKNPPGVKSEIPHSPWVAQLDDNSLPLRNEKGEYVVTKTAGLTGTMVDIIKALVNLHIPMIHVVDAVFAINKDHPGRGLAQVTPEGLMFASLDVVALDHLCARYMFKNVPVAEAKKVRNEHKLNTDFVQKVPLPQSNGINIVTTEGFDAPLSRYRLFQYAEERGIGNQEYYVVGWDTLENAPIASFRGHFGRIVAGEFKEIITRELYYSIGKPLWDLQTTVLSYARVNDNLTGSSYRSQLLNTFDENQDGIIDYEEWGKKGFWHPTQRLGALGRYLRATEDYGFLHGDFLLASGQLKYSNEKWNPDGHDFLKDYRMSCIPLLAYQLSQTKEDKTDALHPEMNWGNGKWPSWQFASSISVIRAIYGSHFPDNVTNNSLYGMAFQYADKKFNQGIYTGAIGIHSQADATDRYVLAVSNGAKELDFVFYVPEGFGKANNISVPNVVETPDPAKVFTAHFPTNQEIW